MKVPGFPAIVALLGIALPALAAGQEVPAAQASPAPSPPEQRPAPAERPNPPVASAPGDLDPAAKPASETDSLAGDLSLGRRIPIGAYGEAHLVHQGDETEASLRRFVMFLGYRFADWARFYSEVEIEDGREIEMEQAYLELSSNKSLGLRAGLLLVPLGIINLYHEPPTFNGVDRPAVDQLILPSTWREFGAGIFGDLAEGLHYQLYVMNGLNAEKFSAERGIGPGRGQGVGDVQAKDAAVTGRVNFNRVLGVDIGAGFYFGGAGQKTTELGGVKVGILEADVRLSRRGLMLRAEYARVFISGADRITNFQRETNPAVAAVGSAVVVPFAGEALADHEFVVFLGQLGIEAEGEGGEEGEGEAEEGGGEPFFAMTINGRPDGNAEVIEWDPARAQYTATSGAKAQARVGERVRWRVVNVSPDQPHTFHLHGHRWCDRGGAMDGAGLCPSGSLPIDNVDLLPAQGVSFEFLEDNPGEWMYHCHIVDHVNDGMFAFYDVNP